MKLPCSHVYHGECITKWLSINKVAKPVTPKSALNHVFYTLLTFPVPYSLSHLPHSFQKCPVCNTEVFGEESTQQHRHGEKELTCSFNFCSPSISLSLPPPLFSFNFLHVGRCSMKDCDTSHMIHVLFDRNQSTTQQWLMCDILLDVSTTFGLER